jgi:hypothetical protein
MANLLFILLSFRVVANAVVFKYDIKFVAFSRSFMFVSMHSLFIVFFIYVWAASNGNASYVHLCYYYSKKT